MNYENFIKRCLETIAMVRQKQNHHFAYQLIIPYKFPHHLEPCNVHLEVYVHTTSVRIKLEEWSFVTHKTLLKSINCEDDDSDPELDNIELPQQNFFVGFEKVLTSVTPKLLTKVLQPNTLQFIFLVDQHELIPFEGENTFVIKVGEFEGSNFQCSVSLKYNYEYQQDDEEEEEAGDSCDFELLIDPVYEEKKRQQQYEQTRKFSENVIDQRHMSPSMHSKNTCKSAKQQKQGESEKRENNFLNNSGLTKVFTLYKQIDFSEKGEVHSSKLSDFLLGQQKSGHS